MPAIYDPAQWDHPHTEGRVKLRVHPGYAVEDLLFANLGGAVTAHVEFISMHVIDFPTDAAARTFAQSVADLPGVDFIEPDEHFEVSNFTPPPNDPGFPGNAGIGGNFQNYLTQLGFPAAWNITQGSSSVKIAVIDTHFYLAHPDMVGAYSGGFNYTSNSAALNTPGNCSDTSFHGHKVSGVIAANANNASYLVGVAPNCLIVPYQCATNNSSATPTINSVSVISAIGQAVTDGCRVINMSFIGTGNTGLQNACAAAWSAGLVLVSGTSDANDQSTWYPGAYPNVIAVGSVDTNNARSSFSGYGSFVNCAANGESTLLLSYDGTTTTGFGTSFAIPQASALAALMISLKPSIINQAVYDTLTNGTGGVATTGFTNSTVYALSAIKALQTLARPCFFMAA